MHRPNERKRGPLDLDAPPPGPSRLTLHDARTRRNTAVWRAPTDREDAEVHVEGWFAGTAVALIQRVDPGDKPEETTSWMHRLNAATGTLSPPLHRDAKALFAPEKPRALLTFEDGSVELIGPKGERRPIPVPPGSSPDSWTDGGDHFRATRIQRSPDGKFKGEAWIVDVNRGQAVPEPKPRPRPTPDSETPTEPAPLTLNTIRIDEPSGRQLLGLWLVASRDAKAATGTRPKPTATPAVPRETLVTAEHDGTSVLLPDLSGVLWVHEGRIYGRALATVDRAAFDGMRRTLAKREAMIRAKQAGLATMMYAQDYDETLPAPGNRDALGPYLKDNALLASFQYTYEGKLALAAIDAPAGTMLGHVDGPGGRAIVYADGHVKWRDDPPPAGR
ncbi:MAG: hypothetical protein ACKO5K_15780 [Armatimonadota bacterium]